MKTLTISLTLLVATCAFADDTTPTVSAEIFVAGAGSDSVWFDTTSWRFHLQRVDGKTGLTSTVLTVPVTPEQVVSGIDVTVCRPDIGGAPVPFHAEARGHVTAFAWAEAAGGVTVSDATQYSTGKLSFGFGCGGTLGTPSFDARFEIDVKPIQSIAVDGAGK